MGINNACTWRLNIIAEWNDPRQVDNKIPKRTDAPNGFPVN
jgi:hypothetical protein